MAIVKHFVTLTHSATKPFYLVDGVPVVNIHGESYDRCYSTHLVLEDGREFSLPSDYFDYRLGGSTDKEEVWEIKKAK